MVRTRSVVWGVVGLALMAGVGLALPPLWLVVDESATPPASALPALPDGARVTAEEMNCASGGCWLELTVDAPDGMSGEDLAAQVLPDGETSAFRSVLDLRRVWSWVMDTAAGAARFSVQYDRWPDS